MSQLGVTPWLTRGVSPILPATAEKKGQGNRGKIAEDEADE
jgi:hypothetical protein